MPSCDAIVIGAGPNGLACAARLAQAGLEVSLLEASDRVGGMAAADEFAPGYRCSLAHVLGRIDTRVLRDMRLAKHGLVTTPMRSVALGPAGPLTVDAGRCDGPDAAAWATLHSRLARFAGALAPFRAMTPPRLAAGAGNETLRLARLGLGLRGMGRTEFREFLRMILVNVADVLEDSLTDDRLVGLVAFDATLGAWLGPRSPNSLILLLNRMAAGPDLWPQGGMAAVTAAMAASARAAGVTIRTDTSVARIVVRGDSAIGVETGDGTLHSARHIVSTVHPGVTLDKLAGPAHLDTGTLRRARNIRSRGAAAKLHLALTASPDFGADLTQRLVIAPDLNTVETAFNAVKYGEVPQRPVLEITCPSAREAGHAPDGHHVLSVIAQFAPHDPPDRDAARAQMLENTLAVLEDHAPGLRALIAQAEILMPWDIGARFGTPGGNWHHAELSVERMLFLRPMVGVAQYATPLPGLWLGGAGTHPGGGVSGTAGWNAAEALLREVRP